MPAARSSSSVKRRLAELGQVREHRRFHGGREGAKLIERAQRLGENHVGAGGVTCACDGGGNALDGGGGARHDHEVAVGLPEAAALALSHLTLVDRAVCPTKWPQERRGLDLGVDGGDARGGSRTTRVGSSSRCRCRRAKGRSAARDAANIGEHVGERGVAGVGDTEQMVRDAGAGEVERAEAGALRRLQSRVGVDRAGDLDGRSAARRRASGNRGRAWCSPADASGGEGAAVNARRRALQRTSKTSARAMPLRLPTPVMCTDRLGLGA